MDLHVTTHCAPPPGFLLASGCARKARHLSGPENVALTQIYQIGLAGLTNQCNQDRLMVHHPALHLESRSFPPQSTLFRCAPSLSLRVVFLFITVFIREKKGFPQHPSTRNIVGLLDPCFKTGQTTRVHHYCTLESAVECEFRFSLASSTTAPTNPLTGARVFEAR